MSPDLDRAQDSPRISVAIVAKDEQRNLARCLRSVAWADDVVVVVDASSTDRTAEIAGREGARVILEAWRGYVGSKNFAVASTRHEWVLSIDADEWLTAAGADEIATVVRNPRHDVYAVRRRPAFCGAFVDRVWSPDVHVRLFRKGAARFEGGRVHESLRPRDGATVGRLREPMPHLTYRSVGEYVERLNRYTDLAAADLHAAGRRSSAIHAVVSPLAAFVRAYVLKRGFLDGRRGWIVACGSAFYAAVKQAKLWERERDRSDELIRVAGVTPEDPDPAGDGGGQSG